MEDPNANELEDAALQRSKIETGLQSGPSLVVIHTVYCSG